MTPITTPKARASDALGQFASVFTLLPGAGHPSLRGFRGECGPRPCRTPKPALWCWRPTGPPALKRHRPPFLSPF
jgi:hypothetical protein